MSSGTWFKVGISAHFVMKNGQNAYSQNTFERTKKRAKPSFEKSLMIEFYCKSGHWIGIGEYNTRMTCI